MPLIQTPGPGRKLQRGLRLTELPDGILAPEIVGVILVEDFSAPLSDLQRGCMGSTDVGPVAAENPILALVRVGAPPQYDLKVSRCWFSTPTTQRVIVGVPTAGILGLTATPNTQFTDFSLVGRPTSQFATDTQIGLPAHRSIFDGLVLADTIVQVSLSLKIGAFNEPPSLTSIFIGGLTVNTNLVGGFEWVESAPEG